MKQVLYTIAIMLLLGCKDATDSNTQVAATSLHKVLAGDKLNQLSSKAISDLDVIAIDSTAIPRTIENGVMKGTRSKSWTSGFYPGLLWQLYGHSQDQALLEAAQQWTAFVEKEKWDGGTHDLGFKIYCPYGNAYKLTQDESYKDVFVRAAQTLSTRYNPKVKAIRSWDHHEHLWKYPVIIDNMMNLELLFEASRYTGDSTFYKIATDHANTTLDNHFRADNSSYHVVDYNPDTGEVVKKNTHQGLAHESAWSRGQAWGLYGYTVAYRYTKDKSYLDQAMRIADYIYQHPNMPADLIPYWDYDVSGDDQPRDVSAAAIAASALLELQEYVPQKTDQYIDWAQRTLSSIGSEKYKLDTPPFFLQHSTGSVPGEFEIDSPIIYAEYYYVEALLKLKSLFHS
jgi:rhamnogalacturonyl hydrolase YesR